MSESLVLELKRRVNKTMTLGTKIASRLGGGDDGGGGGQGFGDVPPTGGGEGSGGGPAEP